MTGLAVSLLPVLCFVLALVRMDSFKLVTWRSVLASLGAGTLAALGCWILNGWLLDRLGWPTATFSRYLAPLIEESAKAVWVVFMLRRARVGFLVDAAIHGFAAGAGFAVVENLEYLRLVAGGGVLLAVVRGFGTAMLHGAATAIFALLAKSLFDRNPGAGLTAGLPGLGLSIVIHSLYNHFLLPPLLATAALLLALPLLMIAVFERSERATRDWLGVGFDSEVELLQLILAGGVGGSRIGRYLRSLRATFDPMVVADVLCLLRIHLELSIRAKGMLMARKAGLEVPPGPDVRERIEELAYLERTVGKTAVLAVNTFLARSSRELWQIYRLAG